MIMYIIYKEYYIIIYVASKDVTKTLYIKCLMAYSTYDVMRPRHLTI